MKGYKIKLEEDQITTNLKHIMYITVDEERIFLIINYMDNRFTIEKNFPNNYFGTRELAKAKEKFNTEDKIKQYLNIGDL